MNDETLQRLIYYPSQLLTAKDFEDQQNYHVQKLEQLTQRFPNGIVRGLKVIFSTNPDDGSEALKILEGLAIDTDGKAIVVPNEGILVPLPNGLEKPFLSIKYNESKSRRSISLLEPAKPFDRIVETVEPIWGMNANISDKGEACITVAKIRAKTDADKTLPPEVLGSNYVIEGAGDPTIRLDASLIGTDQIKDKAVTTEKLADDVEAIPKDDSVTEGKIANNAVTRDKIKNGEVTSEKLAGDVEATPKPLSVTEGKIANNAVTKDKIKNGEVTSEKLALVVTEVYSDKNIAPNATTQPFTVRAGLLDIIKIIPTFNSGQGNGTLSWTTVVNFVSNTELIYEFTVSNKDTAGNPDTHFKVLKINLGSNL